MAMDREIQQALIGAAKSLIGRGLSEREQQELIDSFSREEGTQRERATRSLGKITGLSPREIREKRASDDNADRVVRDLEDLLNN